jgi:hypothetical protein
MGGGVRPCYQGSQLPLIARETDRWQVRPRARQHMNWKCGIGTENIDLTRCHTRTHKQTHTHERVWAQRCTCAANTHHIKTQRHTQKYIRCKNTPTNLEISILSTCLGGLKFFFTKDNFSQKMCKHGLSATHV